MDRLQKEILKAIKDSADHPTQLGRGNRNHVFLGAAPHASRGQEDREVGQAITHLIKAGMVAITFAKLKNGGTDFQLVITEPSPKG